MALPVGPRLHPPDSTSPDAATEAPPIRPPPARRLLYALVVATLVLGALEGAARLLEPVVTPARSIPLPAPRAPGVADPEEFTRTLLKQRKKERLSVGMQEDETARWGLPPSSLHPMGTISVRINALGLRGPEVVPKAPGEVRLLSVGDSSIFGVEVWEGQVLSTVAADAMRARTGAPVSAYIGAVPGYDSGQSLATLRRVGATVAPDWVLVGCLWSDVFRVDDTNRQRHRRAIVGPLRGFALWRVTRWTLAPWLASERVRWLDDPADVGVLDGEGLPPRTPLPDYVRNLEGLVAEAARLGARPAFVVLPAPLDFDRTPVPETVAAYRAAMRRVADEAGAPLVDGPALFKAEGRLTWFVDNVHPSAEGHALLGKALADAILAGG